MENNILVVCNVESSQPVHLYFLQLLFAYFWNAFGDWEILLKCPQFKRMNQKIFSYSLNSPKKNFVRSFIIPIGGKLCKVENYLPLDLFCLLLERIRRLGNLIEMSEI